jgi:hypothetical protein
MIRTPRLTCGHHLRAALLGAFAGTALGCSDPPGLDKSGTFFGPVAALAGGTARAYVTLDPSGAPTDLGVALTETALVGLPSTPAEFVVALPPQASATVYKHATINWQPHGHGPPGTVYTAPHFDVHVYMIAQAEREAMVLGTTELSAKMIRQPTAAFIPSGYVPGPVIEQMGMHWTDPAAPERNGQPFVHTFFNGSYDGTFMLAEPMVTKAFLETKPAVVVTPIKPAAQYAMQGYQATSYTVAYDASGKEYRIALSGLVLR